MRVWNANTLAEVSVLAVDDENICAILVANNQLFAASYACIQVWDADKLACKRVLTGLQHWVRALCSDRTESFVYSGEPFIFLIYVFF